MTRSAVVCFGPYEREQVEELARRRNDPKQVAGVHSNKWRRDRGERETHQIGIAGEVAVAKFYGVMPSWDTWLHGDGKRGDVCVRGKWIDVKTRERRGYDFALDSSDPEDFKADWGVLVYHLGPGKYELVGAISRSAFQLLAQKKDYGYGTRAVVGPQEFGDLEDVER